MNNLSAAYIGILAALGMSLPCPGAGARDASDSQAFADEVLVQAARLADLKAAVVSAEDRFYARYNELNKVEDFDLKMNPDLRRLVQDRDAAQARYDRELKRRTRGRGVAVD